MNEYANHIKEIYAIGKYHLKNKNQTMVVRNLMSTIYKRLPYTRMQII